VQIAIYPVADLDVLFFGIEVYFGGAPFDRIQHDRPDEFDYWSCLALLKSLSTASFHVAPDEFNFLQGAVPQDSVDGTFRLMAPLDCVAIAAIYS
jgi:hypothetical protein